MDFGKWIGVNDTPDQMKRMKSAKSASCTPLSISCETMSGRFRGSSGEYATTLEACTCVDFSIRRLPCKHIFRLAIELGLVSEKVSSDSSAIASPVPDGIPLEVAVEILETYSENAQRILMQTLRNKLYKKRSTYKPRNSDGLDEIIASGLLTDASGGAVSVSDCIVKCSRKLCTYLLRKFEYEFYLMIDENGNVHEIKKPHGSHTIEATDSGEASSLRFAFPNDAVTALLDQYGANRCRIEKT